MSTFTLAISCLTNSNLPWFVDLTFQVPMQYYSSQHQTLLPSPVTSTTGHCFCFGSISSFFLELFLHSSPVAYWVPTDLGNSSFSVISFCLFILFIDRVEGCALTFSCENSRITAHCWTINDKRMLDPTKKRYPISKGKEKPQQDGRRGKIAFRMKPYTCQRCLEGSNKTLCTPGPRDPTETEPCLPLSVWVSPAEVRGTGAAGTGALRAADLGHRACGISPLGGGCH